MFSDAQKKNPTKFEQGAVRAGFVNDETCKFMQLTKQLKPEERPTFYSVEKKRIERELQGEEIKAMKL